MIYSQAVWAFLIWLFSIRIVRNEEWYKQMNVIDFLSKMGRHLRIGDMISKQSVKERLETTGLNFCEFSYQLFQAYDWYHLFTKYGCEFQVF